MTDDERSMAREPRVWMARPDRRWGWVSSDGYEIEWRRREGSSPAGYYLFGPGLFGLGIEFQYKEAVLLAADRMVDSVAVARRRHAARRGADR